MKLIFAVFVLGIAGSVNGQIDDGDNAATWYRKAIEEWQKIDIPYEQWQALWDYQGGPTNAPAPEAVRKILAQFQPALRDLARAARQEHVDYGDDIARHYDAYGDYLPQLQRLARMARLDAQVRLNDGDVAGATGRISDLYRLAGHLPQDERMISSLVGMAVFALGDYSTVEAIDRGVLGMGEAAKLAEAMEAFAHRDPFDLAPALEIEKEMLTAWAHDLYAKRDNLDELVVELEGYGTDDFTLIESSALLDADVFDSSLHQMENAMDRTIELFQLDDRGEAQFELELLAEEIDRGDHGPLAALLMVDMHKAVKHTAFLEKRIAERHALLEAIARGEIDPKSQMNAAVFYRQAMAKLRMIDPPTRELWVMIATQPHEPVTLEQIEAVDRAAEIIALLREGAAKSRCSFTDENSSEPAIAEYLPGMYELTLVLRADTKRALQQGETSNASANLLAAVGMARHLSADKAIVGSMVAHVSLVQMTPQIELALTHQDFTWTQRTNLRDAVAALPQRDPFGYRRAIRMARSAIADELSQRWTSNWMSSREAERFAQQIPVDAVLHGRILTSDHYFWEPNLDRWVSPTAHIRELFDAEALQAVFTWLAALHAKSQLRDSAAVRDRLLADEPVVVLPLAERMAAAEADLAALGELLADPHKR